MKIQITPHVLSIPPYVSTQWNHIYSLVAKGQGLLIKLTDGTAIEIPHLDPAALEVIFQYHARHQQLEGRQGAPAMGGLSDALAPLMNLAKQMGQGGFALGLPPLAGLGSAGLENSGLEGENPFLGMAMQHNPAQKDMPPLPEEFLQKIKNISQALGVQMANMLQPPEPHCHCLYCQVARAALDETGQEAASQEQVSEEPVTDEDLRFKEWDIEPKGDKLFTVTSPLDPKEQYQVYLGTPVGCTCGAPHCEHIAAVLRS